MQKLKKVRKSKGMTVRDLALASGVATSTISKIETGNRKPQMSTLEALAQPLGTTAEDLRKPLPSGSPPTPRTAREVDEERQAAIVGEYWKMLRPLPDELLRKIEARIGLELADRWWAERVKTEASAYGLTVQEYDDKINGLFRQFKEEGGETDEAWNEYFERHWPYPLDLEEARNQREKSNV